MKRFVRYALGVILLIAGIIIGYTNRDQLTPLANLNSSDILSISSVLFIFFIFTGITFGLLVRLVNIRLTVTELLGLTFLTNLVNYVGPTRPGAVAKAVYLKAEKGLAYTLFSSVLAANGLIVAILSGVVGLLLLLLLWLKTGDTPLWLYILCITLTTAAALPFLLPLPVFKGGSIIKQSISRAIDGFRTIKSQRRGLLLVVISVLLQYLVSAWLMLVTYRVLDQDITFTGALVIGVFTSIANLYTFTPNNLGVQEFVMAYLSTIVGVDFSNGLLGAGLLRATHIVLTIGFTPVFTYLMLRKSQLSLADMLPGGRRKST